ncbi:hypothetical protein, partial [Nocardia cyriacigeorgica]|uniref:hypothetical protein n=1 Tax=Nocardia cyriacigeorgica TaxID=135487 RepID=UPI001C49BEF8
GVLARPVVCGVADVELAHRVMRGHRECRVEGCAWKWVACWTLVHFGRLAPESVSPRERAYRRGIEFGTGASGSVDGSASAGDDGAPGIGGIDQQPSSAVQPARPAAASGNDGARSPRPTATADLATLRQVLDGLARYAAEETGEG